MKLFIPDDLSKPLFARSMKEQHIRAFVYLCQTRESFHECNKNQSTKKGDHILRVFKKYIWTDIHFPPRIFR